MAPSRSANNGPPIAPPGSDTPPLADYFFICGVEASQVFDEKAVVVSNPIPTEETIDEDKELETTATGPVPVSATGAVAEPSPRTSRYSFEKRKSVGSMIFNVEGPTPASNRSSATIRAPGRTTSQILNDDEFEEALKKFASERESFLEDIHISAGAVTSSSKRLRPKTVRITQEDNSLKSGLGSIRRRISTMNGMKRQASVVSRTSTRASRRISNYNSVTPAPQPFHVEPGMHPLKRRYEPVLLDRYPTKAMGEELKRRTPFPDYVPMFTFPNDVNVVSSDERPRSTWHGFAMTGADGNKLYGIAVIVWIPLNSTASDGLERECEEWRRKNMSDEERELAASLGERLSAERAKLSRLLARLPHVASGTDAREELEDDISAVEEKISLMADLLRPVRHGAATKIDGLTEGETGFWIPRAYGILGRDGSMTSFWKEWLKAVMVPLNSGSVLRVPPSSPKIGFWQPLERYVCNLCIEVPSPITSATQVEIGVRDLRLYARREALNEIPGSRNTDLYALFRCLSIPNIIMLFEYALAESRVIFLSSHTAMLHLACSALVNLLFPMQWTGILIPVLPARLLTTLEAPCPYIAGVERRYDKLELPDDDFCLVDLDENTIESTGPPVMLPRAQRRKLMSLLQAAAPHHTRFGVPVGPPPYAIETFPNDAFSSENPQIFTPKPAVSTLSNYVSESSTTFGQNSPLPYPKNCVFNAFLQNRPAGSRSYDRPSTSSTGGHSQSSTASPPSPTSNGVYSGAQVLRSDSGLALQSSLREKRSGHFERMDRRNSGVGHFAKLRDPFAKPDNASQYLPRRMNGLGHHPSPSTSTLSNMSGSTYAPSVYAQSTLAASTIMQQPVTILPALNSDSTIWAEGHHLRKQMPTLDIKSSCAICDERCDEDVFKCSGCHVYLHGRCAGHISVVCPVAFRADQVRAAFVRCFASLFYTYRRFLQPASPSDTEAKKLGLKYRFNTDHFLKSVPHGEHAEYMHMLQQTQSFHGFLHERETAAADDDPRVKLFDEIILSKRNRGGPARSFFSSAQRFTSSGSGSSRKGFSSPFSGSSSSSSSSSLSFLADKAEHVWVNVHTTISGSSTAAPAGSALGTTRGLPAKLDPALMKEPRLQQGVPRANQGRTLRKPVPSMLGLTVQSLEISDG